MHNPRCLFALLCLCVLALLAMVPHAAEADSIALEGRVTDEAGAAISHATVLARPARSFHQQAVDGLAGTTPAVVAKDETDRGGHYRLDVAPGAYEIVVSADGRASRRMDLGPVVERQWLGPVALPEAEVFRLRVLDAAGEPAAVARVAARADNGPRQADDWHAILERCPTDDQGMASLVRGKGRPLDLMVLATDGRFFYQDGLQGNSAEVTLENGALWTLRVEDPRGRPMPGVAVHLSQARVPGGRTDDQGRLQIRLPQQPPLTLRLSTDDGYYLRTGVADDPAQETKEHTFVLDDPHPVSGRVVDVETGEGIGDALVWALGLAGQAVTTDRSGGFTLTPLPGIEWLEAAARDHGSGQLDLRRVSSESAEPLIQLQPVTRIAGTVADSDGGAISGASIKVTALPGGSVRGNPMNFRPNRSSGPRNSAEDGTFFVTGLVPGATYELEARRAGFAPASVRATAARPPEIAEVELTMESGIVAVGRIVDESEQPLAGAAVELHAPPTRNPLAEGFRHRMGQPLFAASSGQDGGFAIPDVGLGIYRMEVRRPGLAPAIVPGVEITSDLVVRADSESGADLQADLGVVVMVPGVAIEGRVVDAKERPVAEVSVLATPEQRPMMFAGRRRQETSLQKTTGPDGRFHIADLTPGEFITLHIEKDGFSPVVLSGVKPPTDEPLSVVMQRAATLRGRVIDDSGAAVENIVVVASLEGSTALRMADRSFNHAVTDKEGRFEITQLASGEFRLQATDDAWEATENPLLELAPGEVMEDVELRLSRVIALTGTVRLAEGRPAASTQVMVEPSNPLVARVPFRSFSTQTDAEGRFTLGGVKQGTVTVVASHPEWGEARRTTEVTENGGHVDLVLEGGADIVGQVVTSEGEPAVGAVVRLQPEQDSTFGVRFSIASRQVGVDDQGRFRLRNVADGTWRLMVDHPDFAQLRTDPLKIDGSPMSDLLLQLSAGITVRGRLIGVEFEQLGSAQILGFSSAGMRSGWVRHDGTYRLEALAPGIWLIQASAGDEQRSAQIELEEGQSVATLDLEFGDGFELAGSVLLDGEPVDGARIVLLGRGGVNSQGRTDYRGEFRVSGLEEGNYRMQIFGSPSGFQHHQGVEIPHTGPLAIDVRTANVEGTVRSVMGGTLSDVQIEAKPVAEGDDPGLLGWMALGRRQAHPSSADGAYRVSHLSEGAWRLTARLDGYAQGEVILQVAQGADLAGIDFALEPTSGLWLDLRPSPGAALPPTVPVAVLDADGSLHSLVRASPNAFGALHLSTVPAGRWRLVVAAPGLAHAYLWAEAPGDRPVVTLQPQARLELVSIELESSPGMLEAVVTRDDGTVHLPLFGNSLLTAWPLIAGHHTIEGLPAGAWTVVATTADGRVLRGRAQVAAGETARVELSP